MMRHLLNFSLLALALVLSQSWASSEVDIEKEIEQDSKILVCYYGSWAVYRPGNGLFDVEQIDPMICTHIIYGFVGLTLDGVMKVLDEWNDLEENGGKGAMRRFTNLKQQNPNLKALLAVGGWNDCEPLVGNTCEKYAIMASTQANRKRFIDSVIPFLQHYNFDGFDLDWEYPTFRGGWPEDKANFALLCQEMRAEFDKHGLILAAAVSAGEPTIEDAYDVPSISRSLHFISIMAYDLHGGWEDTTHHQAPLGPIPEDTGNNTMLNVKHAVDFWIRKGAPANKLVLGMGAYGRGWMLTNENENGFYAPTTGLIDAGPYTREPGIWGYNEIIEKQASESGWRIVRNADVAGPYAVQGRRWIGYDDPESITVRVQYLLEKGLMGGMFWSIETDDFRGLHSSENFPLIKTARRALGGPIPTPAPTTTRDPTAPTTTTTTTPRTTTVSDGLCKQAGIIADPSDCRNYFQCVPNGSGGFDRVLYTCPEGTIYDSRIQTCNWYDDVPDAPQLCGW